jgi:hypothetical protein
VKFINNNNNNLSLLESECMIALAHVLYEEEEKLDWIGSVVVKIDPTQRKLLNKSSLWRIDVLFLQ